MARAALLGARGNSGVILSQVVRGAAEELASRPGELVDPVLVSAAFARAADAAYASVRDPAEGTMLTAVRAMASRVAHDLAHMDTQRLGPDATRRGAGRAARRGARERARGRQGGGRARARAARRAARGGRGGRRRVRPDRDHRRLPRGAARRRPRRSSSTSTRRRRCTAPSTSRRASATARTSRSRAESLDARPLRPRARDSWATRCWSWATTARCACTSTRTTRTPRRRCSTDAGEVSRFDVADMHEQVADRSARLSGEAQPSELADLRGGGGGERRGREAPVRGARRAGGGRRRRR